MVEIELYILKRFPAQDPEIEFLEFLALLDLLLARGILTVCQWVAGSEALMIITIIFKQCD